jgi:hypothetical protein
MTITRSSTVKNEFNISVDSTYSKPQRNEAVEGQERLVHAFKMSTQDLNERSISRSVRFTSRKAAPGTPKIRRLDRPKASQTRFAVRRYINIHYGGEVENTAKLAQKNFQLQ